MKIDEVGHDDWRVREVITLRFDGNNEDGTTLHELKASHVAETLLGLIELADDFKEAGAFHQDGPIGAELLVKPAKEGSFLLEVVRFIAENPDDAKHLAYTVVGAPTLFQMVQWSVQATSDQLVDVNEVDGNFKVKWRNGSVDIIPPQAWNELNKKKRRRRSQLRKIMAPLADPRVNDVKLSKPSDEPKDPEKDQFVLTKADYIQAKVADEVEETSKVLSMEGTITSLDFEGGNKWSVRIGDRRREVTIEDSVFLEKVRKGLKISGDEVYRMLVQEDRVIKNGRSSSVKWTILHIKRKEASDDSMPDLDGGGPDQDSGQ